MSTASLTPARNAIYSHVIASYSGVLTLDNEAFDEPDTAWTRLSVRHTSAPQETLGREGNRRFSRFGSVFMQIFVPIDTGTDEASTLAKEAADLFEGLRLIGTTIRFLDVIPRENGRDGKWYNITVEAQFEYDETK